MFVTGFTATVTGLTPTVIVALIVLVAPSITDTAFVSELVT